MRSLLGEKYEDKQFPPRNESIGDLLLGALGVDVMEWPRLSEREGGYEIFKDGVDVNDVI